MTTYTQVTTDRVQCDVCGAGMTSRMVGTTDMLLCKRCGMGRAHEMQTDPDFWVSDGPENELDKDYWTTARSRMFERALGHLETNGKTGRLLDFGGGVGYFAQVALGLGWDAFSLDVSEHAQKVAAERIGAERSLAPYQLESFTATCDVVTLWCVVAHVPDPLDLVRQAVHLLKPGGCLLLTTPNFIFQGALARVFAKLDKPYDLVCRDHLLHYTPAALELLLQKAGLQRWSFEYLGVTDNCFVSERFARVLVPLKRVWNYAGSHTTRVGLPPLSSELQVVATRPR